MPGQIIQQLRAIGVAQVIAVLKPTGGDSGKPASNPISGVPESNREAAARLESFFRHSELSSNSAIAAAGLTNPDYFTSRGSRSSSQSANATTPPPPAQYYPNLGVMLGTVDREGLIALRSDKRVSQVIGAPLLRPIWPERVAAAKLTKKITWGIDYLAVPRLWKEGLTGKSVRVAHLDTGVDGKHPALKKAVVSFAEFDTFGQLIAPTPKPYDTDD